MKTSRSLNLAIGVTLRLATIVLLLAVLGIWLGSFLPAWAQGTETQSSLNILGDPLELQIKEDEEDIPAQVVVRNESARSTEVSFSAVIRDSNDKWFREENIDPPSTRVKPYSVTPIDLKIDKTHLEARALPLGGYLVASGALETISGEEVGIVPGTLALTVSKPKVLPPELFGTSPLNLVITLPFVISFLVVILCSLRIFTNSVENLSRKALRSDPTRRKLNLLSTLGSELTLDFTKSWASLLAVGAGIVAAVTSAQGAQVFPSDRPYVSQQQVAGLAFFFAAMVVFGPTVYNFLRRQKPTADPVQPDDSYRVVEQPRGRLAYLVSKSRGKPVPAVAGTEPQLQGFVSTFLLSSALTLGALLGQLTVAGFLIYQIDTAVSDLGQTLLIGAILVIEVLAIIFTGRAVFLAVKDKGKRRESFKQNKPGLFRDHYTYEESQTAL